ncbi:Glu/Leu/Phe/Val dehydrogenase dimerization domain-containing protein [Temperatibacter marinus]|uniref:Glu/Leu/Phe/Val dehydrogenase dimerization domain-containing protein n=1 Tax=Temperatibacter marinus TaxID=1456591 RepID=A0AA52EFC5_9PROT|nr:Glu/Leu/Phe/Val dehydrogenase dimerization domain-containing protein [Temperatibacter marinus]WND02073.1 Glu/Leu/Phe/Val dehydrogenase dimerization domain-containing protein [Temperatibacter marinus]
MPVFDSRSFKDHEQVVFISDEKTGLKAIVAVHSTALGPATGGCRFWDYYATHKGSPVDVAQTRGEQDAVYDVLRLSRGMSYKNAMAGLRLGGGKSVIIGNSRELGTPELMAAFGRAVNKLGGMYYAAEDVGTSPDMMEAVHTETDYVAGLAEGEFATGDPSPHTALGVFVGIKAACEHKYGSDSLEGKTVAIQGVGHVGAVLADHLRDAGAKIIIADIVQSNIDAVLKNGPAEVVEPSRIHAVDCDVFAPCALGGGINPKTIPEIKAKVIAGAANNVLETEGVDDQALMERGILYAPDYVINAGGIISVEFEVHKEKIQGDMRKTKVLRIGETLKEVFETAEKDGRPSGIVANEMAEAIIKAAQDKTLSAAAE